MFVSTLHVCASMKMYAHTYMQVHMDMQIHTNIQENMDVGVFRIMKYIYIIDTYMCMYPNRTYCAVDSYLECRFSIHTKIQMNIQEHVWVDI